MLHRYEVCCNWKGRVDSTTDISSFRWHQAVQYLNLNEAVEIPINKYSVCILGFCCDEGVRRNMGRVGAAKGPASIRKELANLPSNFLPEAQLFDAGNITCQDGNMEDAQAELAKAVCHILDLGLFPILIGGGHEIALGHFNGILQHQKKAPSIINFDAHLDLRPIIDQGSSGTMFNQIYEHCQSNDLLFDYLCIGAQSYANTKSLFNKANAIGAKYILATDIKGSFMDEFETILDLNHKNTIYLTLCTDVLSAAHAPGVSAVQPFGLEPDNVLRMIKTIIKTGKVCSIDIAEVSPRFDSDNRTAKLVAVYIYAIVNVLLSSL